MGQVKKTKIIATLGPATDSAPVMGQMIEAGVNVFRLNFSHGSLDSHAKLLSEARRAGRDKDAQVAIMGDLCGPRIRIGKIEGDSVTLSEGGQVTISGGDIVGNEQRLGTNYSGFLRDVLPGHRILIDDGQIVLRAEQVESDGVVCRVVTGGKLTSYKGINLPDTKLSAPSITDYDWRCAEWAVKNDLDFLALSFVRSSEDIVRLKTWLDKVGSPINVVAKVETPQAIAELDAIVRESDAVLVARGDLGVEMPFEEVPILQKQMTHLCRSKNKSVIVATQMLQSMMARPTATRAEVSDVANAIMDYTDAVMLSGETAVGRYPVEAVRTMQQIGLVTERFLDESEYAGPPQFESPAVGSVTAGLISAIGRLVEDVGAVLVALWSEDGLEGKLLSRARIDAPAIAFSSDGRICRRMSMQYGLIPCCCQQPDGPGGFVELVEQTIRDRQLAEPGDRIVLLTGQPLKSDRFADALLVHTLGK